MSLVELRFVLKIKEGQDLGPVSGVGGPVAALSLETCIFPTCLSIFGCIWMRLFPSL